MKSELKKLNAGALNGTKYANKSNDKIPLRFSLSLKSEHFERWIKKYSLLATDTIVKEL